jgi:hypothetical protein
MSSAIEIKDQEE